MSMVELPAKLKMEGIGEVRFKKNLSSKYLRISIKPGNEIHVSVPAFISFDSARHFVEEKKAWILRSVSKLSEREKHSTLFKPDTAFRTRDHTLQLRTHPERSIKIIVKSGVIYVFYPDFASIEDPRIQRAIRKGILEAWRMEALKYLPERVKELASRYGFRFNKLSFRNNKTRWGSCSRENNISLHIQLMRLPQHLTDYIILHELAHTVHKNHGEHFWKVLQDVTGNAKGLDKELNRYRLEVW